MNPRVLVAVATYNERENLPSLVDAIEQALPDADLLIVDDNSPDGTGQWADERAASDSRLTVLHRAGKMGLGSATFAAMRHAREQSYNLIATLDADWSHPPDRLPNLIAKISAPENERFDVAIGSRYCRGGAIVGWPFRRHVASRMVNFAARWLLRLPVRDASGAFRAYRVDALTDFNFETMRCTGYAYLEEILWRLKHRGATFTEVPITFTERREGESKINRKEVITAITLLFRLGFAEWTGKKS